MLPSAHLVAATSFRRLPTYVRFLGGTICLSNSGLMTDFPVYRNFQWRREGARLTWVLDKAGRQIRFPAHDAWLRESRTPSCRSFQDAAIAPSRCRCVTSNGRRLASWGFVSVTS